MREQESERESSMDLSVLQALEREKVLEVLQRDKVLRSREEDRIRRLKSELQEIKRRGAKSFNRQYSEKTCARCQRPLGKFWNSGSVCPGCSHRICSKCRVGRSARDWKCTVCHAYREVKIRSGEWFLEERAKKYPAEPDRHETVGEKLLKSYHRLSHISVVPPTPPPSHDCPSFSRYGTLKKTKPFTKSMEDLMVSLTSHIRKMSKSQTDVRDSGVQDLLTVTNHRQSFSDTDINKTSTLSKGLSLPSLLKRSRDSELSGPEEDPALGPQYSGHKRESSSSSTDCSLLEHGQVTGDLELNITFNDITSCLEITVRACRNLTFGDMKRKKCHPYVKMYLLPERSRSSKMKTSIKRNTTDPVYDEVLQCQIERPQLSGRTLQASVWHSATLKKKVFLGEALIPLEAWMFEDPPKALCYPLGSKPECSEVGAPEQSCREILIRMKFSSLSQPLWVSKTDGVQTGLHDYGQLTVVITGAKNLPTKTNSSQNSYVKGWLALPRSSPLFQRTRVLKVKPRAGWCHQLLFSPVSPCDLLTSTLDVELWVQASFSLPDRLMGRVRIEPGSPWQQALQMPNTWHDFSLPVQDNISV